MLYDWPTWTIVAGLFALMLAANELGFRAGRRDHEHETEPSRSVSNALKGSVFGLVALLLAFSFSATTSRHDVRQRIVLDQANAVGTCYLRAGLLDDPERSQIRTDLQQYVRVRLEHFRAARDPAENAQTRVAIDGLLSDLWKAVEAAHRRQPEAVRNSLIVPAANEVIDLSSDRVWAGRNHLPMPVLALLFISVVVSSALLGHSSGLAGRRHFWLWVAMNVVFALVLFVILDFDRPHRGLIQLDPAPLVELNATWSDGTEP